MAGGVLSTDIFYNGVLWRKGFWATCGFLFAIPRVATGKTERKAEQRCHSHVLKHPSQYMEGMTAPKKEAKTSGSPPGVWSQYR